ncbi:leukocyte immunoglobulin-like receptor subfamily B member 1 isoform X2 [Leptonychotes weddellii]|uniref:Leukocyte immunoglobulin-like receptor subfamily B member 1 isoform X2 n=1 Tax=Leptonychotes weddellii TaxID=9713 RepID=A0A7F8RMD7_LEPWE|nr:leukocyte immunoglobulin-like receptor subfamily B member 1 isoform X2 [Leptonychotes weddellii]
MSPGLIFLLGLVFCLEQRIWAQHGLLPQPSIWALPGAVIPQDSSVTIYCKGPPGMLRWWLLREGLVITWYDSISQGVQGLPMFFIQAVTYINAGIYYCGYWKEGVWSGRSDPLDLVVTGVYKDTPSLTALPGPNVTLGGNVTLLCQASQYYHVFNLFKDGRNASPQDFLRQDHKTFLISPVTLAHGGTYRCYGSSKSFPHRWSLPSNPVKLLVTGNIDGETKNQVKCKSTNSVMDFQEENQCDVLEDIQPEKDRQVDIQAPIEEDPQEVTYAQLHQETLRGSVDTQFSHTHKDSSDQRCVYATLTLS